MKILRSNRLDRAVLRRAARHQVGLTVGCKVQHRGQRTWTKYTRGVVMDVSRGGLGVRLRLGLRPGAQVRLELFFGNDVARVSGRVAWASQPAHGGRVGIALDQPEPRLVNRLTFLRGQISGELASEQQCSPLVYLRVIRRQVTGASAPRRLQ